MMVASRHAWCNARAGVGQGAAASGSREIGQGDRGYGSEARGAETPVGADGRAAALGRGADA